MKLISLKATDFESLDIISALSHGAIFYNTSFDFQDQCFKILVNRFMWENAVEKTDALDNADDESFFRVHNVITFSNVSSFKLFGFDVNDLNPMVILSIHASEQEINISISDNRHILLNCRDIMVTSIDTGNPWPTQNLHLL